MPVSIIKAFITLFLGGLSLLQHRVLLEWSLFCDLRYNPTRARIREGTRVDRSSGEITKSVTPWMLLT
jgi:hypothetical protein